MNEGRRESSVKESGKIFCMINERISISDNEQINPYFVDLIDIRHEHSVLFNEHEEIPPSKPIDCCSQTWVFSLYYPCTSRSHLVIKDPISRSIGIVFIHRFNCVKRW